MLGSTLVLVSLSLTLVFSSFCIFSGLHDDFYQKIELTRSHLIISPPTPYFQNADPLLKELDSLDHVEYAPSILSQGLVKSREQGIGVFVIGLDPGEICKKILHRENCDLEPRDVVLSSSLGQELGILKGQEGSLIVADGSHYRVRFKEFFVDFGWSDQKYSLYLPLPTAQSWIYGEPLINRVEMRTGNPYDMESITTALEEFDPLLRIITWRDLFAETLKLFEVERKLHFFFFGLLTVLIGISVYLTFLLFFLRKSASFRTTLRLGYPHRLLKLAVASSVQILLLSSLLTGGLFSHGIRWYLKENPIELPQSLFYSPTLPFHWDWNCFLLLCLLFFLSSNFGCLQAMQRIRTR